MEILKSNYINENLIEGRLQNGLSYYIIKKEKYISKLGLLGVNFGSIDNKFSIDGKVNYVKDGTAHLLEHLVFEHKHYNVMDKFNKLGASVNAYTNFTNTAYYFNTIDNYYYCIDYLIDFVYTNYINEKSMILEKNIIYSEIKMFLDNPQYRAFFCMISSLIKKSSNSTQIVGTISSVESITINELNSIFETFYVPTNMTFIGIGNIDEHIVIEKLNRIKKKNISEIKRYYVKDESNIKNKIYTETMPVSKDFFCFGLKIFKNKITIKEEIVFGIIVEIIFSHSSSFYELLSLKGLIDKDFSFYFLPINSGGIIVLQGSSNNPKQVLEEILESLEKINNIVSIEEFQLVKNKKLGQMLQNFNNIEFIASFQMDLFNKNINFHDYFELLTNIEYRDIESIISNIKVKDNFVLSIINSKPI